MPLAFPSVSHGEIAFGFFNIDGDMLLLERTFFFADAFCEAIAALAAAAPDAVFETTIPGWVIDRAEDVGDLMGAIHGVRHTGFIGDVYRRFPFPAEPEDFRQHTRGFETRDEFRTLIEPWATETDVRLAAEPGPGEVTFADVRFRPDAFRELVRYVGRGGWPRWEDAGPPDYVLAMRAAVDGEDGPSA
ncbi:MAG: hypothetical protein ABFS86_18490 [Planctomycetota bacterium]